MHRQLLALGAGLLAGAVAFAVDTTPPTLTVTAVDLKGTVDGTGSAATVTVNLVPANVAGANWDMLDLPVVQGANQFSVQATDGGGLNAAKSVTVTVNGSTSGPADLDGDGIPDAVDPDRDGDGVDNDVEVIAGTNPNDNLSVPTAPIRIPITCSRLLGRAIHTRTDLDSCTVKGILPNLPPNFSPAGKLIRVDVGGAAFSFTLDAKGRSAASLNNGSSFKLTLRKVGGIFGGGDAPFQAKLARGNFADDWADEGLDAAVDQAAWPMPIDVTATMNTLIVYEALNVPSVLNTRAGASSKFRYRP